jgi:hypothetical protein
VLLKCNDLIGLPEWQSNQGTIGTPRLTVPKTISAKNHPESSAVSLRTCQPSLVGYEHDHNICDPFDALINLQRALEAQLTSDWLQDPTTSRGAFPPINVFQQGQDLLAIIEVAWHRQESKPRRTPFVFLTRKSSSSPTV